MGTRLGKEDKTWFAAFRVRMLNSLRIYQREVNNRGAKNAYLERVYQANHRQVTAISQAIVQAVSRS